MTGLYHSCSKMLHHNAAMTACPTAHYLNLNPKKSNSKIGVMLLITVNSTKIIYTTSLR